jgi:hypothetical protein
MTYFYDKNLQEQFEKDGYVIVDFLNEEQVETILGFLKEIYPQGIKGTQTAFLSCTPEQNLALSQSLSIMFQPLIDLLMPNRYVEGGTFIVKAHSDNKTIFNLHQDYNQVNEKQGLSMALWTALTDTHQMNGGLCVIPGSHKRYEGTIRSVNKPSLHLPIDEEVNETVRHLDVKRGQACIFAHSLFHGSPPNLSDTIRPIIHSGIFPNGSKRVHYNVITNDRGVEIIEELAIDPIDQISHFSTFLQNPKNVPHEIISIVQDYTPTPTRENILKNYGTLPQKKAMKNGIFQKVKQFFTK